MFRERQKADAVDSELEQLEFTETQKRTGATTLLGGLAFMHSRGVAHRDVKSLNLLCNKELTVFKLVSEDIRAPRCFGLFLSLSFSLQCDFGLSRSLGDSESVTTSIRDVNPRWVAPEIFNDEAYSVRADLYSAGVRIYYFCIVQFVLSRFSLFTLSSSTGHSFPLASLYCGSFSTVRFPILVVPRFALFHWSARAIDQRSSIRSIGGGERRSR